ncbi:radical SAM family heme chaperone HemW [Bacteroidales bacterium OttesenSCG-928-A17]|nr:radical SAM family heme chaperone HemW [Bacteroidales bacterium OttesenSCG-928-A17]
MAGIYIHIPFCKKRCIYCDFFSSVSMKEKPIYIQAVCEELISRRDYLGEKVETIYFGGGTPSLLSKDDFELIFKTIRSNYTVSENPEITLEANPDDLTSEYLGMIEQLPFNRISMGVQSLNEEELRFLNRRHDASRVFSVFKDLKDSKGIKNISVDLIYGLPNQDENTWRETLKQVLELDVRHISAYHLIYEEGTKLYRLWTQQQVRMIEEDLSLRLFEILIDTLESAGFEHYEISNFARPGFHSRHNSSYWEGKPYLGVGASAHSYNGASRSWNSSSLDYWKYPSETEIINTETAYNEFILTRLRTKKGVSPEELKALFGDEKLFGFRRKADKYLEKELLRRVGENYTLSRNGLFISDGIMSDLMD